MEKKIELGEYLDQLLKELDSSSQRLKLLYTGHRGFSGNTGTLTLAKQLLALDNITSANMRELRKVRSRFNIIGPGVLANKETKSRLVELIQNTSSIIEMIEELVGNKPTFEGTVAEETMNYVLEYKSSAGS